MDGPERDLVERLIQADLTIREIAQELGCSTSTVGRWLREFDLKTTRAARRKPVGAPDASDRPRVERIESFCRTHGPTEFVRRSEGGWRCVRCRAEQVAAWRRRMKVRLVQEAGGCCRLCGYDRCAAALTFHHLDPAQKRFALGSRGLARSLERVRRETDKCVLLCANCHAEVEAGFSTIR